MRVTRRTFLAAVGYTPFIRRSLAADVDVLIVGAGAAGLAAANIIRTAGRSFSVLESRSRIGGRAFTDTSLGGRFDAGAHYIHWAETNPWRSIAAELGVPLNDDRGGPLRVYRRDVPLSDSERRTRRAAYLRAEQVIEAPGGADQSFAEAVSRESVEVRDAARSTTLFALGEDPERVSVEDYRQLWSGEDYIPAGGYGSLVARYGSDIPVDLATTVTHLRWGDGRVEAETPRGVRSARAAIVTVPIGVLKSERIRFTPKLPQWHQQTLEGLHMGALTKIALRADRTRFPRVDASDLVDVDPSGAATSFELWPDGQELVLTHIGGDVARDVCNAGERAAVDFATERLASIIGASTKAAIQAGRLAAWWTDPNACGSYSIVEPRYPTVRLALRTPIGERVWLAGEASAGGGAMTVGGATLEGVRAAREVLERLAK